MQYHSLDIQWGNHDIVWMGATVAPESPCTLTRDEIAVMDRLRTAFMQCDKLAAHVQLLLNKGSLYKVFNHNLLYHGCVPLNEDGAFCEVNIYGKTYGGRRLYDVLEAYVRKAFFAMDSSEREWGRDILWFIWSNKNSPLFGKEKMDEQRYSFVSWQRYAY